MKNEKIRRPITEDRSLHFGVCGVKNLAAERFGLAFQLKGRLARRTTIVDGGIVLWSRLQSRGIAGRAEEMDCAPGFGANSGALRGALVVGEALEREMQIHAGIRSHGLWRGKCCLKSRRCDFQGG
jgi:hypothetical protein